MNHFGAWNELKAFTAFVFTGFFLTQWNEVGLNDPEICNVLIDPEMQRLNAELLKSQRHDICRSPLSVAPSSSRS